VRVLVTGGAGFIGSHLVDAFVARDDDVVVVDDLSTGQVGRLDQQVVLHQVSITEAAALTEVVAESGAQLVCHLAAQIDVRASVASPAADAQANVVGTVNVLEAARLAGARVLFASSGGALYGRDAPVPSHEDVLPKPESPYGTAKYCAECYIGLYNRLHGTSHSVMRLANVYGPRQDPAGDAGVITTFCARALASMRPTIYGDGTQTRDYVYVGDVVAAFLAAAGRAESGTWNIGTAMEVSVRDLVEIIARIAGRELSPVFAAARPGELARSVLAVDLSASELGWRAATPLTEGIRRVYQWIAAGAPDRTGY
jgi:UDP-glucose 4-epimerase